MDLDLILICVIGGFGSWEKGWDYACWLVLVSIISRPMRPYLYITLTAWLTVKAVLMWNGMMDPW